MSRQSPAGGSLNHAARCRLHTIRRIVPLMLLLLVLPRAGADVILLDGGDRLQGTIAAHDATTVTLDHSVLGTIKLPIDKIESIDGKSPVAFLAPKPDPIKDEAESNATPAPSASPAGTPAADAPPQERVWKNSFTLAGSTNSGTSDNASLFLQLKFERDNEVEKTSISSFYRFASADSETNQSWYNFTLDQLWKLPEVDTKWQIFADLQFDWSEFNSWEQRISLHAGGQHPLLHIDKTTHPDIWYESLMINGRVGLGPRKEFAGIDTDVVPEADLGGNLDWKLTPKSSVLASAAFLPDLADLDVYRINASLNWKIKLEGLDGLAMQLGMTYQFQSQVEDEDKNYDLLTTVGMSYDF